MGWALFLEGIWKSLKMREVFDLFRRRRVNGFRGSLEGRKADRNVESKLGAYKVSNGKKNPIENQLEAVCGHSGKELAYKSGWEINRRQHGWGV